MILDTSVVTVNHVITVTVKIVNRGELVRMVEILIRVIVELVTLEKIASATAAIITNVSMDQLVKLYRDHQTILVHVPQISLELCVKHVTFAMTKIATFMENVQTTKMVIPVNVNQTT